MVYDHLVGTLGVNPSAYIIGVYTVAAAITCVGLFYLAGKLNNGLFWMIGLIAMIMSFLSLFIGNGIAMIFEGDRGLSLILATCGFMLLFVTAADIYLTAKNNADL